MASTHTRLLNELRTPVDDPDPERAQMLCAEISRKLLGALAPGLLLLSPAERLRFQALTAFARTLFDFALEEGMHGERLARINRWEYMLDLALDGQPPGQPIFVALAGAHATRPWSRDALDQIVAGARRVSVRGQPEDVAVALPGPFCEALTGQETPPRLAETLGGLLLAVLDLRSRPSARSSLADTPARQSLPAGDIPLAQLGQLPISWRRFVIFLALATDRIAARRSRGSRGLGLPTRLWLLGRARFAGPPARVRWLDQ